MPPLMVRAVKPVKLRVLKLLFAGSAAAPKNDRLCRGF
jgi:hypothetical protein